MKCARMIVMIACLIVSSSVQAADIPARKCKALAKSFFREPSAWRLHLFENADAEEQYAIYICGNQYMHPPMLELADALAARGQIGADFLRSKLEVAKGDLTTRDITRAYLIMKRMGTYDVGQDAAIMRLLATKIAQMKGPSKETTEEMFAEIGAAPQSR